MQTLSRSFKYAITNRKSDLYYSDDVEESRMIMGFFLEKLLHKKQNTLGFQSDIAN